MDRATDCLGAAGRAAGALALLLFFASCAAPDNWTPRQPEPQELSRFFEFSDQYVDESEPAYLRESFTAAFTRAFYQTRHNFAGDVTDTSLVDAAIDGIAELSPTPQATPSEQLTEASVNTMLTSLDRYSGFLDQRAFLFLQQQTRGEFGGLGVEITMEEDHVKVISPIDGTPAFRAGIQPGDLITHLDGDNVAGMTLPEAVDRMRGQVGTDIDLRIQREAKAPFDVTITRALIRIKSVRWRREGNAGYVRITTFDENATANLAQAIEQLHGEIGPDMSGIVLDLRNNPGGLRDEGIDVSDIFLRDGGIVSMRGRHQSTNESFSAESGDSGELIPLVVLINRGSASASEIVAGALQDNGRGIVMGQRSFGKGSVQTIIPLPGQVAMRLTTAHYYSPSGRGVEGAGIMPNVFIKPAPKPDDTAESAEAEEGEEGEPIPDEPTDNAAAPAPDDPNDRPTPYVEVDEAQCPDTAADDAVLGCALALLQSGGLDQFMTALR